MAEMTEDLKLAIYGYNAATGKAYTPEEAAAASGGYNPYAGYTEAKFDPVKGEVTAINPATGQSMTLGAKFRTSGTGGVIPAESSRPPGVAYDDSGKPYGPGQVMPGESLEAYVARMAQIGPGVLGYGGKQYQYNSRGMFYESGTPEPADFVDTTENSANTPASLRAQGNMSRMGTPGSTGNFSSTGAPNNPYEPGTPQYEDFKERRSAYDLLFSEFKQYGLDSLVTPLKDLIMEGVSPAEFTIRLRETDAYKKRFAANAQRVAKGLRALSEAEYIGTEDQYQDVMRRYGMPESYYTKGDLGVQSGFEKFLAGDVSAVELEDRIQTAQNRVVNSNPEVARALKEFYPGISNGDILAYVLDPANAIEQIKRKVTAAEIGGAAIQSGLKTGMTRAEELAAAGITKAQAQQGFQTVAEVAPRGGVLAEIYKQDPYTQTTAEQEVFGLTGAVDAARQRRKLTQLETAAFSGSAGAGAIARDRAGAF